MQNLSPYYPTMLMASSLMRALKMWDQGTLQITAEQMIPDRVFIALFQAAVRTLQSQNADGSWGKLHSREETAYACLTLAELACLPSLIPLQSQVENTLVRGQNFLANESSTAGSPDFLWIEKVTYGLNTLSQAYILAARNISMANHHFGDHLKYLCAVPTEKLAQSTSFFTKLPLFSQSSNWQVVSSLIEGYMFLPQLKGAQPDIFPGQAWDKFKYFEHIPFTWIGANYLNRTPLGAALQLDMMIFSLLVYQVDEYMEAVLGSKYAGRLGVVTDMIESIFDNLGGDNEYDFDVSIYKEDNSNKRRRICAESSLGPRQVNGQVKSDPCKGTLDSEEPYIYEVDKTLRGFVAFVLKHPGIKKSRAAQIEQLRRELKTFLLAHVAQLEDNARFSKQGGSNSRSVFDSPRSSFFHWVYHTSSDHTSCPLAFAFLICRIAQGKDFLETAEEKYYAEAVCRHLAVMCRMYNDHGSLQRDRQEMNLNSINFPEFGPRQGRDGSDDDLKKDVLFRLAAYERKCLELALSELAKVADPMVMGFVRTFCDVTDMYGQMYVLKDLTQRM